MWQAYEHLDQVQTPASPLSELTALVALIRRVTGLDSSITTFASTVQRNFKTWIFQHNNSAEEKFSEEQLAWLHMIRDQIMISCHFQRDDLEISPFDAQGGLGRMYQLFGDRMDWVIAEMNKGLVA